MHVVRVALIVASLASAGCSRDERDSTVVPPEAVSIRMQALPPALSAQDHKTSVLQLSVDSTGHVANVIVKTSSGNDALDTFAAQSVRQWQFKPAMKGGIAMASTVLSPITFDHSTLGQSL